ncbi:ABC transporter permease [Bacteroides sp.]
MRQLYYSIRTLLRGWGTNLTKIISLTLGLFIGILLFSRVVFELSFDSGYKEADKLCVINAVYTIGGEVKDASPVVMGPVPGAIYDAFPEAIESVTVVSDWYGENTLFKDNIRLQPKMIMADSLYFQTMGIEVISGDPKELTNPEVMFVSQSFAREAFGDENPVGKTLLYNKNMPMTVKGIYADLPENCSLPHDVVISFSTIVKYNWQYIGWDGGDSFLGFVRLKEASNIEAVNARIDQAIEKHMPYDPESGWGVKYSLQPLREIHAGEETVHKMILIMVLLAVSILFIAAMNYVLISISSLARRAKAVGVHKCNGASNGTVFSMFLWETGVIILVSLLLVFLIMINFRERIEDIASASLTSLFTWNTLWVPLVVVVLLFLISGLLPGRLFSSIPVTQVFHRYTDRKSGWKRTLLFVQFAGVSFIFGVLCVVLFQYNRIMTKDLGYNPDRVACVYQYFEDSESALDQLRLLPMVEGASVAGDAIISGYGGMPMQDEQGKTLFTARLSTCTYDYLSFMGVKIVDGKGFDAPMQVVVNEEFARRIGWADGAVGKKYMDYVIVGVMNDYPVNSFYEEQKPVALIGNYKMNGCYHVRLKAPFDENLRALNQKMLEMFPTADVVFKSLRQALDDQYKSIRRFRDAVALAFLSILIIALMGLIGYVNDEVQRRSKEISIRKVNGAGTMDILSLLSTDILWTALPAVALGAVASYFVGRQWLEQFAEKVDLMVAWFVLVALVVLVVIMLSVIIKAWRIANENPVNSIKSE